MKIAIIGGGLTGLTAAYELLKSGHRVTVFEKGSTLGGLAGGFTKLQWKWSLEFFYHHFFTNDTSLISLAKELGLEKDMLILRPITAMLCESGTPSSTRSNQIKNNIGARGEWKKFRSSLPELSKSNRIAMDTIASSGTRNFFYESQRAYNYSIFQLDSPLNLLTFPLLSPLDKARTAALLAFCKLNPFWQPLEKITAEKFFKTIGGSRAWNTLWQPLMEGKFGPYAKEVPASWLWARFRKRTMRLGYFRGGFQTFIDALADAIKKQGGIIYTNTEATSIEHDVRSKPCLPAGRKYDVRTRQNNSSYFVNHKSYFDKVLLTTPSSTVVRLLSQVINNNETMKQWSNNLLSIPHLWAQALILETKEPILTSTYWLNIADSSFPFVAVVAHTNMVDKKYYGGRHITYIGNYLPDGHPFLKMTKQQLLKKFLPYLQKINQQWNNLPRSPRFGEAGRRAGVTIQQSHLFTSAYAQPVHTLNYSKKAPILKTPTDGIYLANLDSVYPWDRGTNYAVELGKKVAGQINV